MSQILIPLNNTVWGVVPHAQKSDAYRHIVSFETEREKDYYISNKLFNKDEQHWDFWKDAIKDPHFKKSLIINSATSASATIDLDEINKNTHGLSYTQDDLLNMDFLIVQENDETKFYTVIESVKSTTPNQKTYTVTLELDIFFTYDIKDMINDLPMEIDTAHNDRYYANPNDDGYMFYEPNIRLGTPQTTAEDFDGSITEGNFIPGKSVNPEYDFTAWLDNSLSEHDKNELNKLLNKIQSITVYSTKNTIGTKLPDGATVSLRPLLLNGHRSPYYVTEYWGISEDKSNTFIYPSYKKTTYNLLWLNKHIHEIPYTIGGGGFFASYIQEDPTVISMDTTMTSTSGIHNMLSEKNSNPKLSNTIIKMEKTENNDEKIVNITFEMNDVDDFLQMNGSGVIGSYVSGEQHGIESRYVIINPTEIKGFGLMIDDESPLYISSKQYIFNDIGDDFNKFNANLNQDVQLKWETKPITSPYSKIKLLSMTTNEYDFKREYLIQWNSYYHRFLPIYLRKFWTYQPDIWREIVGVNGNYNYSSTLEKKNIYDNSFPESKLFYDNITNYPMPTAVNAYNEYEIRNKSQQNNNILQGELGVAGSAIAIASAPFTGGLSLAVGAIGLASSITSLNGTFAKIKDLKRTPNKLETNGSKINGDLTLSDLDTKLVYYNLTPAVLSKLQTHFMMYGVKYGEKLYNFNDVIKSRYWFNFVKAPAVFENIEKRLAPEIKILINDTIAEGVTIWHVRSFSNVPNVKIKNYEKDNCEMALAKYISEPPIIDLKQTNVTYRQSSANFLFKLFLKSENFNNTEKYADNFKFSWYSQQIHDFRPSLIWPTDRVGVYDDVVDSSTNGSYYQTGVYNDITLTVKYKMKGSDIEHTYTYDKKFSVHVT